MKKLTATILSFLCLATTFGQARIQWKQIVGSAPRYVAVTGSDGNGSWINLDSLLATIGCKNCVIKELDTAQHPGAYLSMAKSDSLLALVQTLLHTNAGVTDSGYWYHGNDGDVPGFAQLAYGGSGYAYYNESAAGPSDWWDQHMGLLIGGKVVPTWGLIPGNHTGFQTMVFKTAPTYVFHPGQHLEGAGTPPLDFVTTDYSDNYNFATNDVDEGRAWSLDAWTQGPGSWYSGFSSIFNNRHISDVDTNGVFHGRGVTFLAPPSAFTGGDSVAYWHYVGGTWVLVKGPAPTFTTPTFDAVLAAGNTTTHVPQVTVSNGLGYELTGTSNNQQTAYAVINDGGVIGEFGITGSSYSSTGAFQPSHAYIYGQQGVSIAADNQDIVFGKGTGSNYGAFDFSTGNLDLGFNLQVSGLSTTDTTLFVSPSNGGPLQNRHIYPSTIGAAPATGGAYMPTGTTWDNVMANGASTSHAGTINVTSGNVLSGTGSSSTAQVGLTITTQSIFSGGIGVTPSSYTGGAGYNTTHAYVHGSNGLDVVGDNGTINFAVSGNAVGDFSGSGDLELNNNLLLKTSGKHINFVDQNAVIQVNGTSSPYSFIFPNPVATSPFRDSIEAHGDTTQARLDAHVTQAQAHPSAKVFNSGTSVTLVPGVFNVISTTSVTTVVFPTGAYDGQVLELKITANYTNPLPTISGATATPFPNDPISGDWFNYVYNKWVWNAATSQWY